MTFHYLATPYSKYPLGIVTAFEDACQAAARLIKRGYRVYSPIAHCHPIAMHGDIDPLDGGLWQELDIPIMQAAESCLVVKMPSWEISRGVAYEIALFERMGKEVVYLSWPELEVVPR